jgi:tetratricopeptide (TPR) repeat protein
MNAAGIRFSGGELVTEAQTLFQEGVAAIRDRKDIAEGRRLLTQSLRLDPNNAAAWLWLARAVGDPDKQRQCVERALQINPEHPQALALKERLAARQNHTRPPAEPKRQDDEKRIQAHLEQAQKRLDAGDAEGAIEEWVRVLDIRPDHEAALANAVRQLSRMKYFDDAKELVWRALDSGTTHPSIYLTGIDILRREGRHSEADDLRRRLALLPTADESLVADTVDHFIRNDLIQDACDILTQAVQTRPNSQKLLLRLADLNDGLGQEVEARRRYEQVARLGLRTPEGKQADAKLRAFLPVLTDRERGSLLLAVREALGVGLFLLLMGWQDAGLDMIQMGAPRWAGVAVGTLGAYLLVTATSSPQQKPLAGWLGGKPAEVETDGAASVLPILPVEARLLLGLAGLLLVALALYLVFGVAIGLLTTPTPPEFYVPSFDEIFG